MFSVFVVQKWPAVTIHAEHGLDGFLLCLLSPFIVVVIWLIPRVANPVVLSKVTARIFVSVVSPCCEE